MNTKLLFFLIGISLISCKDNEKPTPNPEPSATQEETKEEEIKMPTPSIRKPDTKFIEASRGQQNESSVTDQIWHYVFALSIKDPTPKQNIYEGHWLDLLPDGSFKQGVYQDTTDHGYYTFTKNGEEQILEMRSDKGASEWKVKTDPAHMLLVGTAKYGNNPWQIKLSREQSLPTKKN